MKRKTNRNPELLPIRLVGDHLLRRKSEPIAEITDELRDFIDDLTHTMYEKDGVGLAAPQVGRLARVFVIDPFYSEEKKKNPIVLINPKMVECSGEFMFEEGCLSLPKLYAEVKRCKHVRFEAWDIDGKPFAITADEYLAVVLQHEYDHLDGVLFIDRINRLKLMPLRKKIRDIESLTNEDGVNIQQEIQ